MKKILFLLFLTVFSSASNAGVSVLSRANCASFNESVTWGWPESERKTSSWQLEDGLPGNFAFNVVDNYRVTWRSYAGANRIGTFVVRGKHWWAHESYGSVYHFANTYATGCNLSQW